VGARYCVCARVGVLFWLLCGWVGGWMPYRIYIRIRAWGLGPVFVGEDLVREYTGGRCDDVEAYTEEEGQMERGGGGPRSCDTLGHIAHYPKGGRSGEAK